LNTYLRCNCSSTRHHYSALHCTALLPLLLLLLLPLLLLLLLLLTNATLH
jgi:MYXO-CTERM domain-containing protein